MNRTQFAIGVGLALAAVWIFANFLAVLGVIAGGLVGFVVAKVLDGDLDLTQYINGSRGNT